MVEKAPKNKIAYIKIGNFSYTNVSVHKILVDKFPEYKVEVIDIKKNLLNKVEILIAHIYVLLEFGKDILLRRKTFSGTYIRTSYFFNRVKKRIIQQLDPKEYLFSFQTQSLFDASVPGIPNFLYTDHTHLANLTYPGFNKHHLFNKKFIAREQIMYQNAILNFTMSLNISKSIIEEYQCKPEKVACVNCGSNVQVKQTETFSDSRYYEKKILFVGVEWERKGGPAIIEAFKQVLVHHPDATLTIVGCSPEISIPNCNVVGRIPLNEVKKYFENSSIFCLPTTLEPLGIAFLEAMAHKLPVIGSNIGAIPDFIIEGKNGYLIEPNNTKQIAERLLNLLESPEKSKEFGEFGHQLFWNTYTWEMTGIKMHDHILKTIGELNSDPKLIRISN